MFRTFVALRLSVTAAKIQKFCNKQTTDSENMDIYEKILAKEEINKRFKTAVTAIMVSGLISSKSGLAEALGVKPAKFSEILNGRMNVGVDMIARMCDFYGISPDWLLLSRGNNVFRQMAKEAIWVDDENLNMKYAECEIFDSNTSEKDTMYHSTEKVQSSRHSKNREETKLGITPNATPISPAEESIIYKMYKEEKAEKEVLIEQIGQLKERLRQLEGELVSTEKFQSKTSTRSGKIATSGAAGLGGAQFAE